MVEKPPTGGEWLHEIKLDGYRMVCFVDGDKIRWETRNDLDWSSKLSGLTEAIAKLKMDQAIFDGEVVSLDKKGVSNFQLLQNSFRTA